jgi:hypothetical protein
MWPDDVATPGTGLQVDAGTPGLPLSRTRLRIGRMGLAASLALLLLMTGPIYEYRGGNAADYAKLDALYGPPDGSYLAYGPPLYQLPVGWLLLAGCLFLAASALPFGPPRLQRVSSGTVCLVTGILMLTAVAATSPTDWIQRYLGIGGTFGHPDVVSFIYEFLSLIVLSVGVAILLRNRWNRREASPG